MSRKLKIDKKAEDVNLQYANWFGTQCSMIDATHMWIIAGRATAKTEEIIAKRVKKLSYEMPGCFVALTADTFMNVTKNILPGIIEGLKRKGWKEGVHFVVNEKPPKHFKKPFKTVLSWRYTMTTLTGTHFKIISQDRPSIGAGDSYQHKMGDEAKYLVEKKLNKLTPAVRGGSVKFMLSHLYGGSTFVTDMPNINHNEHDWILRMEKNMNKEQIVNILKVAYVVNEIKIELYNAIKDNDLLKIKKLEKNLERWEKRLNFIRKDSTFFARVSSFANADILKVNFFKNLLQEMNFREFKTAILSIPPKLEKGKRFYPNLSANNFYRDGINYNGLDKSENPLKYDPTSMDLKYMQHNAPIEGGLDTGNMNSLVLGQPDGRNKYRLLKFIYTLPPDNLVRLGAKFREYFKYHSNKHLILYHDRSANQNRSTREDQASKFQRAVEFDEDGISTGWTVTLMNRGQGIIHHQTEYELMLVFLGNFNKNLPTLLIDESNCKEVKSSFELSEKFEKVDKHGSKTLHKNKTSEKLAFELLPMHSTNPSDAVKYLLCRPEFLEHIEGYSYTNTLMPGLI
ncbi:hypothetical protein [Tenacibaculum finnmarkense]|uniref:hypothetical protein n=1 Tax=Tenacibaculum finnmarkense TaxID=2781243 RepID=UPI00187B561B|nr:hypothetical protein [Tenacibaculum finnmarkense]MBE7649167.1 hypothetical protein [Tenacibaculum finnmarkense genomovar ulcerans]